MAWVCICGQRNVLSGLPCLACDRAAPAEESAANPKNSRGGSRFRDNGAAEEVKEQPKPVPRNGGRRFLPGPEDEDLEESVETPVDAPTPQRPFDLETHADIAPLEQAPSRPLEETDFENPPAPPVAPADLDTSDDALKRLFESQGATEDTESKAESTAGGAPEDNSTQSNASKSTRSSDLDDNEADLDFASFFGFGQKTDEEAAPSDQAEASPDAASERRAADRRQSDRRNDAFSSNDRLDESLAEGFTAPALDQAASIDEVSIESISDIFGFPTTSRNQAPDVDPPARSDDSLVADVTGHDPDDDFFGNPTTVNPVVGQDGDSDDFDPWSAVSDDLLAPEEPTASDRSASVPKGEGIDPAVTARLRAAAGSSDMTTAWWNKDNEHLVDNGFGGAPRRDPQASDEDSFDDESEDAWDDGDYDDPYSPTGSRHDSMFVDDVDLDEPDEFESSRNWDLNDDDDEEEDDAPRSRRQGPPPRSRKKAALQSDKSRTELVEALQRRSVLLLVAAALIFIALFSTLGSTIFDQVGGTTTAAEHGNEVACQSVSGSASFDPASLSETLAYPLGWVAEPDYAASTGVVDFSRALKAEPDSTKALAALEQTRFVGGFDRSYENENGNVAHISVYAHAAKTCATDYANQRSLADPRMTRTFDTGIEGAQGYLTSSSAFVVANKDNKSVVVEVVGKNVSKSASELARTQLGLI